MTGSTELMIESEYQCRKCRKLVDAEESEYVEAKVKALSFDHRRAFDFRTGGNYNLCSNCTDIDIQVTKQ